MNYFKLFLIILNYFKLFLFSLNYFFPSVSLPIFLLSVIQIQIGWCKFFTLYNYHEVFYHEWVHCFCVQMFLNIWIKDWYYTVLYCAISVYCAIFQISLPDLQPWSQQWDEVDKCFKFLSCLMVDIVIISWLIHLPSYFFHHISSTIIFRIIFRINLYKILDQAISIGFKVQF